MFSLIKVGERSGTGLCDIYSIWKKYGYERPIITETIEPDRTTLTLQIEVVGQNGEVNGKVNSKSGEVNGEDGKVNGEVNYDDFSKNEILVYEAIATTKNATRTDLIEQLDISARTIDRAIKSLKEKGAIERIGSDKNGYWKVRKRKT